MISKRLTLRAQACNQNNLQKGKYLYKFCFKVFAANDL